MNDVDLRRELREVAGLFHRTVTPADDDQRTFAEARQGTVAHRTGRHAHVLELVLRLEPEVVRSRPPVAMITDWATISWPSSDFIRNGRWDRSISTMSSVTTRVPKFTACCRISSINSGPLTP